MKLPPMPLRAPIAGSDGRMSGAWARWFAIMYEMVGVDGPAPQVDVEELMADVYTKSNASILSVSEDIADGDELQLSMLSSHKASISDELDAISYQIDRLSITRASLSDEETAALVEKLISDVQSISARIQQLEEKLNDQELMTWLAR